MADARTEREKMLAGGLYDAADPELAAGRLRARGLLRRLRDCGPGEEGWDAIRAALLPNAAPDIHIEPPFHCDYGWNIHAGGRVYFNANCVVLDVCRVEIGPRTLVGPAVQIYTALHPLDAEERALGLESGAPVRIGADCWIGGGAVVLPGVSIGEGTVVGAGSVVARDLPPGVLAVGNPARIVRVLGESRGGG